VISNINRCFDLHLPIVVGTTAWQEHYEEIKQRCLAEKQSLFTAPNFSIGMNIMFLLNKQLARLAERYGYQLSLAETHHIHKLDKPSGTAVKLANDIMAEVPDYTRWSIEAPADHTLYIEAKREGEVFGIHSVTASSAADRITITHQAFNRQGLAAGALAAAEFLVGKTGIFGMDALL
jgi:4-hydroxy-tetrahydrodipicolinate reductase